MNPRSHPRVFLDSNVILGGFLSTWGLDKAVLSLGAAQIVKLIIAEVIRREVERNLLIHAETLSREDSDRLLGDYDLFIQLSRPEIVPPPDPCEVRKQRSLIRHLADVPVLLSALSSDPEWFITHNTEHFSPQVVRRTGLRIVTPRDSFSELIKTFATGNRTRTNTECTESWI